LSRAAALVLFEDFGAMFVYVSRRIRSPLGARWCGRFVLRRKSGDLRGLGIIASNIVLNILEFPGQLIHIPHYREPQSSI
jgi:hypothetical protein